MKRWISILLVALVLMSCNHSQKKNDFVPNPTTLEELFRGFNKEELTPDIIDTNKDSIIIVATGHLYPLLKYPSVHQAFIDSIKAQHPDCFFSLGDIVYNNTDEEWDTVFSYYDQLNTRIYFAPGNHDLNYHYERYFGKRDHEIEAEMRYLKQVGFRYKLLKDNLANYVFINANDSVQRILTFLNDIRPYLDKNKHLIMLSSQSLWFNKQQEPGNNPSWVNRPFHRDEFLPHITDFEYLIHGDWGGKFYRGKWKKKNGFFDVMAVGNRKAGDSLFITKIIIYKDTIVAKPIRVDVPAESGWYR